MAARTIDQLAAAVENLGSPSDTGSSARQFEFINAEYRNLAGMRRWEWLQGLNSAISTVVGTVSYSLSSITDLRNLDAVWVTDAQSNQIIVRYQEPLKLLNLQRDQQATTKGSPQYWSVWGGNLLVYPNPDAVYSLTIAYTKNVTTLTTGQSPLIPEEYDDYLVWGAASREAFRTRDFYSEGLARQQQQAVLSQMISEYQLKQRQTDDAVVETGIWNQAQLRGASGGWSY